MPFLAVLSTFVFPFLSHLWYASVRQPTLPTFMLFILCMLQFSRLLIFLCLCVAESPKLHSDWLWQSTNLFSVVVLSFSTLLLYRTSSFSFSYRYISFILWTKICASLYCSSLCFNLSIYRCLIWSTITYRPLKAYYFFWASISYCSLIFFNLSNSIILSFFFYWVLKSYQSLFFSSNCLSRIVAALAYATILFISFTSSSCYCVISTALWFIAPLFASRSLSNSSGGILFFFSSSSRSISSRLAFANDNLYSFSS